MPCAELVVFEDSKHAVRFIYDGLQTRFVTRLRGQDTDHGPLAFAQRHFVLLPEKQVLRPFIGEFDFVNEYAADSFRRGFLAQSLGPISVGIMTLYGGHLANGEKRLKHEPTCAAKARTTEGPLYLFYDGADALAFANDRVGLLL